VVGTAERSPMVRRRQRAAEAANPQPLFADVVINDPLARVFAEPFGHHAGGSVHVDATEGRRVDSAMPSANQITNVAGSGTGAVVGSLPFVVERLRTIRLGDRTLSKLSPRLRTMSKQGHRAGNAPLWCWP
jgi:hypothetical protein